MKDNLKLYIESTYIYPEKIVHNSLHPTHFNKAKVTFKGTDKNYS